MESEPSSRSLPFMPRVAEELVLAPGRILFVGDTGRADIDGPQTCGFRALHVTELEAVMQQT